MYTYIPVCSRYLTYMLFYYSKESLITMRWLADAFCLLVNCARFTNIVSTAYNH